MHGSMNGKFVSSPKRPVRLWYPHNFLLSKIGAFSSGVEQPWREANHLSPQSVEVKNGSTPSHVILA
jgi:hypothetical protein